MVMQAEQTARSGRPEPPATGGPGALRALSPAGWLLGLTAVAGCGLAFAGLSTSSWWIDELFTLFLVDHRGGPAEVLRRALTDTHPPAYYLLLCGWSQAFGLGEAALRSLSAILAVGAVVVFVRTTRGLFTREARAFATAVAVTSPLWFFQAQNIRNYSLCFLLTAVMLQLARVLRRRVRAGAKFPAGPWAALTAVALLDAMSHFYGLLGAGALLFALIATVASWRLRAGLAASGLLILTCDAAYAHLLASRTHEDWRHLWFSNDARYLLGVPYAVWQAAVGGAARVAVLALAGVWALSAALRRRPWFAAPRVKDLGEAGFGEKGSGEAGWLMGVCGFMLAAVYLGGVAESLLFAPTLSDRNVLTAAPAAWVLLAGLYDVAMARLSDRLRLAAGVAAGLCLLYHGAALARGRWLSRNEAWRASAAYVVGLPACAGASIPVVQPERFGPDTPFYRALSRRWFFGRYLGARWPQIQPHLRGAFVDPRVEPGFVAALAARAHDPGACPVLAWGVHDVTSAEALALQQGIARLPGVSPVRVRLRSFDRFHFGRDRWVAQPSAFVIERVGPQT